MTIRLGGLTVLLAVMSARAAVFTDAFDAAQDYLVNGVAGTSWDGFFYNLYGGNTTVAAADADSSNAGVLTFRTTYGNWENGDNDGVLLYKTVAGDFDARVQVISMNVVAWHDGGLMARVADTNDAGSGEDWVAVKHFANSNQNGHRSTDNNVGSTISVGPAQPWLRLTREGNTVTSYRSADGVNWSRISASTRNDMGGLALQVGLWQATFSGNQGTALFDNFSLRTPAVWNLGTGGSWTASGNWTNGVPSGSGDWISLAGFLQTNASVTLDGSQTAGRVSFDTTNTAAYSIDSGPGFPASTLTIDDASAVPGNNPTLDVKRGAHAVTVPVVLSNGVTVTTAWGTELQLRSGLSGTGGLVKEGAGTLTLTGTNATYSGTTLVNGGTLNSLALPDGIQASYRFDNPDHLGEDSSVNGNDLTASGAPAYAAGGKFGGAVYLNGSSHFVRSVFPAGVPTGGSPYTIALWEKDDGSGSTGGFVGWGNNAANQCNNLRFDGANALKNYWYGNDWTLTGLSTNPKDGNWHHLVVTWDGTTQRMYVDGNPVGTSPRTGLNAQATNFTVGRTTYPVDANFKGWLDNVQLANRALSAREITELMQSGGMENMLPVNTSLQVASEAVVDLNGANQALAGISGGGRVTSSSAARAELTVGGDGSSREFSGTIDGEIALAKVGAGALTLSGLNAYNGGTTVSGGTLVMSMPSLLDVLTSSAVWFDAADAATLTTNAGGLVTLWANKGTAGSALDAVPITFGTGPTVLPGDLNGNAVLSLDGTEGLRTAGNLGIYGTQNRTLFAVGSRKNNGSMFLAHTGSGVAAKAFGIASEPTFLFNYLWSNDIIFPVRPNNAYEIYDYMLSGGNSTANLISGETTLSGSKSVSPNTDNTPLYLGSRFGGIGNGNLAEVIVFNRALTQGERAGIEAYLRAKWFTGDSASVLSAGAVVLAAGAVLDLDGTAQTLTGLSGGGLVTNGTLTVTGTIAPGGTNAVGTLTLADVTPLSGTLLVDGALDGTCDRLEVQGALDLTGLSLRVQDASLLKAGERYVIASCAPGTLTGPFASTTTGSDGWTVSYNNGIGEVLLLSRGLLLMVY
jgi:autotransporter-associated beta strand protein